MLYLDEKTLLGYTVIIGSTNITAFQRNMFKVILID